MKISQAAVQRIADVASNIDEMEHERQGWGLTAMNDVNETARSFVRALGILMGATDVYIDGGTGYSFGGMMPGGIAFGMIAREVGKDPRFNAQQLEWSFHS